MTTVAWPLFSPQGNDMARKTRLPEDIDKLQIDAIKKGLDKGDPQMVRAVEDMRSVEEAADILSELDIEVTHYTISDTSLREIVLNCPDYILVQIEDALRERRHIAEHGVDDQEEVRAKVSGG